MIQFRSSESADEFLEDLRELDIDTGTKVRRAVQVVAIDTVAFLRSHTEQIRPPARNPFTGKKTGPRPAHPGRWADITGDLARAFKGEAVRLFEPRAIVALLLTNIMEYAEHLEGKHGYWIFEPLLVEGGRIDQMLGAVLRSIDPSFTIERARDSRGRFIT